MEKCVNSGNQDRTNFSNDCTELLFTFKDDITTLSPKCGSYGYKVM